MDDNERILNDLIANNFSDLARPDLTVGNILIISPQMGAGTEPQPDGETDQDLVPEQEDEEQEEHSETERQPGSQQQQRE